MEVIKRKTESEILKVPEEFTDFQVSFNSWGHIVFRWFNHSNQEKDVVLALSQSESHTLVNFIRNLLRGGMDC